MHPIVVKLYQRWSGQFWTLAIAVVMACSLLCLTVDAREQAETGFYRGVRAFTRGDYAMAVVEFVDSIGRGERLPESYDYLCSVHFLSAEYMPAIARCSQAIAAFSIRTQPSRRLNALLNRGLAYRELDRLTEAARDFSEAIAINPQDCRGYFNRGLVNLDLHDARVPKRISTRQWDRPHGAIATRSLAL